MYSTLRSARAAIVAAYVGILALTPLRALAQIGDTKQSAAVTMSGVAAQLGARVVARDGDELPVGGSFSGTLADPAKLVALGVAGMHEGARVTVMRVAPDKLRIEVDELDPVPLTKKATLKIDATGKLAPAQ